MRASSKIRELIEEWERQGPRDFTAERLYEVERLIIKLEGRMQGTIEATGFNVEEVGTYTAGKLEATEKHLEDMRKLVLMENEKGEV